MLIFAASVAFCFPEKAVDQFDPIKRLLLSAIPAIALLVAMTRPPHVGRVGWIAVGLMVILIVWILFRQFAHDIFWREWDVTVGWLYPALFFLSGWMMSPRAWRTCSLYLGVALGVQSVVMALQFLDYDPIFRDWIDVDSASARMIGFIGYHNQAAAFLSLCAGACFFVIRSASLRLMIVAATFMLVTATGSRGALLGLLGAILVSGSVFISGRAADGKRRRLQWMFLAVFVVMCGLLIAFPVSRARFVQLAQPGDPHAGVTSRIVLYQTAVRMWQDRPMLGWGGGAFAYQYIDRLGEVLSEHKDHNTLRSVVFARETHNMYLQMLAEFGLVGLLIWTAWALALVRLFWRRRRHVPHMAAMGLFAFVYSSVHSLVSFPWLMTMAGSLGGLMLGAAGRACSRIGPTRGEESSDRKSRLGPVVPIMAVSWLLSIVVVWHAWTNVKWTMRLAGLDGARHDQAVDSFSSRPPPWGYKYLALLGGMVAEQGDHERALALLTHAESGYRDVVLLNNLGHVQSRLGNWDAALIHYLRWMKSGLEHREALDNVSVAYENLGQADKAFAYMQARRLLWPGRDWPDDVRYTALALSVGEYDLAVAVLQSYEVEDLPLDRQIRWGNLWGATALLRGETRKAEQAFLRVLELDPDNAVARRNLSNMKVDAR